MRSNSFNHHKFPLLGLLLCLVSMPCFALTGRTIFFTLEIDGNKVGYQKLEWSLNNGEPGFTETFNMDVVQGKSRALIKNEFSIWKQSPGGQYYLSRELDAGTVRTLHAGRVSHGKLQLKNKKAAYVDTSTVLPAGILYPIDQLQWFTGKGFDMSTRFDYFDPQSLGPVSVKIQKCDAGSLTVPNENCWRRSVESRKNINAEYWYFDDQKKLLRIETFFAGARMIKRPCENNCMAPVDNPWDFIGRWIVKSPYKIPEKAAKGKINYLISSKSGRPLNLLDSAEQSVRVLDGKLVVSVCANCEQTSTVDAAPGPAYSSPNPWVESDNYQIRRLAGLAAPRKASIRVKMNALVKLTQRKMTGATNYLGYSSALEALRSGSGDCGEFALLLAAFSRSQGIPTRVVFGMAYSGRFTGRTDVFSPHAWVQVWDSGHWVSYDAALNLFDATHIALAEGTGNPHEILEGFNQLGDIQIEKAAAIVAE